MPDRETDKSSAPPVPRFEPDQGWVPADERLVGVDRRTIAPTLAVFALVIVMSVVLPVIKAMVPLIAVVVLALVIAVRVYELTVGRERDFVRDAMIPEEGRNVITAAELDAMAGNRKARKRDRKAERNRRERKRARYVLNAAYDLADELAAARCAHRPSELARTEVGRIRAGGPLHHGELVTSPRTASIHAAATLLWIGYSATRAYPASTTPRWTRHPTYSQRQRWTCKK